MEIMLIFLFSHLLWLMCSHLVNSWACDVARLWDGEWWRGAGHCRLHHVPYSLPNQIGVSVPAFLAVLAGDWLECQCQHLCWGIQLWLMITSLMFTISLRSKHGLESPLTSQLFKDKLKHLVLGFVGLCFKKRKLRETLFYFYCNWERPESFLWKSFWLDTFCRTSKSYEGMWDIQVKTGSSVQFSSVAQSCPTLCDPMNHSTPGLPVHHQLLEFTQTHIHRVSDAIQPSHPLSSPSPPDPNPSQHQNLFQWVNSSHEVAKVLEFQL